MSFTLYVSALDQPFTEREILEAFSPYVTAHPITGLLVRYDAQNESVIDCTFDDERTTDSFSVHRPCANDRLFEALHGLLAARPSFLTYPDENSVCIVATDASASRVREKFGEKYSELVEALRVCATPQALIEAW
jgi:hypothetical protein